MPQRRWLCAAFAAGALAWSPEASGASYPVERVLRPLTLPAGTAEVALAPVADLSSGRAGEALALVPSITVGATDAVQLALFSAPGVCVTSPGAGCARAFDGLAARLGVEVLRDAAYEVALHVGAGSLLYEPLLAWGEVGAAAKVRRESAALVFDASVRRGLSDREASGRDAVVLSAAFLYQLRRPLTLDLDTGITTPFDTRTIGGARDILVPVALGATYTPFPRLDVGVQLGFTNLLGNGGGVAGRSGRLLVALRL